jgi:5'-3' exoribonuclease 1
MAKLTQQLKYFINKKITEDVEWQGVDIILSGHEVPGEGEHKIMEYIRLAKAQPDYDANIRHCLYGLDADLIMLGLLSHDPHFCLLREEVTFGRKERKSKELEHQNFYLMHECIIREYLELEFQELKAPGALSFPFDMERVIDDFILMAFFVGNDFLPNLPNLHINEGALALMFKVYKSVLPKAHGYLNERGVINLERLALLLDELSHVEYRFFEAENADADWFRGKKMAKVDVMDKGKEKEPLVLSSLQRALFVSIKDFVRGRFDDRSVRRTTLDLPPTLQARDRKFIQDLASSVGLDWKTVEDEDGERFIRLQLPERYLAQVEDDDEDIEDEEVQMAVHRALKRYEKAPVVDVTAERAQDEMEQKYQQKFRAWKDKYYKKKLGWGVDNEEELRKMAENYVQGLQWVLFYYYRGVASWPWYYGYHYAPMISGTVFSLASGCSIAHSVQMCRRVSVRT